MAVLTVKSFKNLVDKLENQEVKGNISHGLQKLSFKELASLAKKISSSIFESYGQKKVFFVEAKNNLFFVSHFLGVVLSGNIPIPLNPFTDIQTQKFLEEKFKPVAILKENEINLTPSSSEPIIQKENFIGIMTSGSTGDQKTVIIPEKSVFNNALAVIEDLHITKPENIGIILPIYHSFALITQLITTLLTGGNIFLLAQNTFPGDILKFIQTNKINTLSGVPTTFKLLNMGTQTILESVKHITIAGAALDPEFTANIKKNFPNSEIWVGYGLTEAGPRVTAISTQDPHFYQGSVGKPLKDTELKIEDKEVLVKSNSLMSHYLNDNELKIKDGWLYTGDTGEIDKNGYLFIQGRKDNLFISAGEKISPDFIEKCLNQHDNLKLTAVYGEKDDLLNHKIVALLEVKPNETISLIELRKFCKKTLPSYMIPHKFFLVEEIPLTPNGKIKRKELITCPKITL